MIHAARMTRLSDRWRALHGSVLWTQISSFSVRLIDLPSRYAFHLLVAAQLGVAAAGGFYIAFSIMMLVASLGRCGLDRALTRAVARSIALDDPGSARRSVVGAFRIAVPLSLATTVALAAIARPIAVHLLAKPDLAWPLTLGAATVLPLTIGVVAGGALAGLHRMQLSLMVYSWLWPALFCLAALVIPLDIQRALMLVAAATAVNAVIALVLLARALPPAEPARAPPEPLMAMGIALFSTEVVQLLLGYAPVVVLGIVASNREVGLYALAWRIALAINLLIATVAAISAPRFAALHATGDQLALRRASGQAIAFVAALAIVPVMVMLAFPVRLLGLVGHGFEAAAPTLRLLLIGQLAAVLCTASAELLGMTDHAATLRRINLATLAFLAATLALLGSRWGSEGAALATSLTIAVNGLATSLAVRRHLGFVPLAAAASLWRPAP